MVFFKKNKECTKVFYKYKSFNNQTLDSLVFGYYWAQPLSKMNDVFEGVHALELYLKKYGSKSSISIKNNFQNEFNNLHDMLMNKTGVLCLTTDHNNQLMWAHYGDSYYGICIEYDESITLYDDKIVIPISYNNKVPLFNHDDRFNKDNSLIRKIIGNKSHVWNYEKEYRVIHQMGTGSIVHDKSNIKSIYFGHRIKNEDKIKVFRALKDSNVSFYQMIKSEVDYSFRYDEISNIPKFKYFIWEDQDLGVIEYNYKIDAFNKYLKNTIARILIYTKDFISEDLSKSFHKHLMYGLCSNINHSIVLFLHESEKEKEVPISYYSFQNDFFSNNIQTAKEFKEQAD